MYRALVQQAKIFVSDIYDYVLFYVHIQKDEGKAEFKMCVVFYI